MSEGEHWVEPYQRWRATALGAVEERVEERPIDKEPKGATP